MAGIVDDPDALSAADDVASAAGSADEWCDAYNGLGTAREAAPDDAPEPIRDALRTLNSDEPPESFAQLVDAAAEVEAWAHENCGMDHPFCAAWTLYKGFIAGIALSDASEEEKERAFEESGEVLAVVDVHAPADVAHHLETVAIPILSEEQEREGEAAFDALDAWVDGNCTLPSHGELTPSPSAAPPLTARLPNGQSVPLDEEASNEAGALIAVFLTEVMSALLLEEEQPGALDYQGSGDVDIKAIIFTPLKQLRGALPDWTFHVYDVDDDLVAEYVEVTPPNHGSWCIDVPVTAGQEFVHHVRGCELPAGVTPVREPQQPPQDGP